MNVSARSLAAVAVVVAAGGCDDGIRPTSVVWAWAGGANTCATNYDRVLRCWGSNTDSRVGDGSLFDRNTPVKPGGDLRDVSFVSMAGPDVCAIADSRLLCWGPHSGGDGSVVGQGAADTPNPASVITDAITQVSVGDASRCVLKADGSVWFWGQGSDWTVGDGTRADAATPVAASGLTSGVTAIQTTTGTLAIKNGALWGWGDIYGTGMAVAEPAPMVGADGAALDDIFALGGGTCILGNDSRVWCWAVSSQNGFTSAQAPTEVDVGDTATPIFEIAVGAGTLCRLDGAGVVQCEGRNDRGQLGDGTTAERFTMAPVLGLPGRAIHIAAGEAHACALLEDRKLRCWGANDAGQLGVGDTEDRLEPALVRF
jgi:alpha-tubulin suppressor-like RCC1 family protein